jgi:transposase
MEACGGSHWLARKCQEFGHKVKLKPPQYVKPYVKTNKNDYIDADAIAEAATRPTMLFVSVKLNHLKWYEFSKVSRQDESIIPMASRAW